MYLTLLESLEFAEMISRIANTSQLWQAFKIHKLSLSSAAIT